MFVNKFRWFYFIRAIKEFSSLIIEKWKVKYKKLDRFYLRTTVTSYSSIPPKCNSPYRGDGAYLTKKFLQSASTRRAQLSVAVITVRFNGSSQL